MRTSSSSVDFKSVLSDPSIDAVALATPAITHYEMAKAALQAGKDVFVEKPLAIDVKHGERLVELAAATGRILMVGHILRYHPAILKLQELIQSGALGKIDYLYSNRLNIGKIRAEENILWSFAPHDISVMLALLNEMPNRVSCQSGAFLNNDVADVTLSHFDFPSGVQAHIFVSWLHPFKEQKLVVVGSEKMAVFDDTAEHKLVLYPHKVEWKNRVPTAVKAEAQAVAIDSGEPLTRRVPALSRLRRVSRHAGHRRRRGPARPARPRRLPAFDGEWGHHAGACRRERHARAAVFRPRVRIRRRGSRGRRGFEDLALLARHEGRADRDGAPTSDRTSTSTAARSSATT